jgi:predicted dehydrogenase
MTRVLRVGVVGGSIGAQHIEAYQKLRDLYEVRAFCDIDEAKAKAVAERFGIPVVLTAFDDLLGRDDIDIVDICTPAGLHFEQTKAALRAKKHVVAEKPLAGSLAEADELARVEAASGRRLSPIFQYRFGHGMQRLLHLKQKGVLGRTYVATVETHWKRLPAYYEVPWRGKWATELGGSLVSHAIHAHDLAMQALGEVKSVYAKVATRVNEVETEDCAALTLELADGGLVSFSVTMGSAVEISRLRFCFEHATLESSHAAYNPGHDPWQLWPMSEAAGARIEAALADFTPRPERFEGQFSRLHRSLTEGGPLPVGVDDARASLELVTAAYHSSRTGTAVALPLRADHPAYRGWQPEAPHG